MRRRRRGDHEGSGLILGLALVVVLILGLVFLTRSRLSSQTSDQTRRIALGDRLELLADSAIEEAMARIRREANDPASELFGALREIVYAPELGEMTLLGDETYAHTRALLDEPGAEGLRLETPEVKVCLQKQLDSTGYERRGLIRYRAVARQGGLLDGGLVRRVERVQSFKLALAAVPMPHGSYGLFLAHLDGLFSSAKANAERQKLVTAAARLRAEVASLQGELPSSSQEEAKQFATGLLGDEACERAKPLPQEGEGALYGLIREGASVRFELLRIDQTLMAANATAAALEGRARQALGRARASRDEASVRACLDAYRLWDGALRKGLWTLWAFNRAFRFLPRNHEAYDPLAKSFYKFDAAFWERRVQFRVRPRGKEAGLADAWERFRGRREELRGVIRIENEDEPFRLGGRLRGSPCIVVGRGGLVLEDLNADAPAGDEITVVALGGTVRVRGRVRCALILARDDGEGTRLRLDPDCRIDGALVAHRLPEGSRFTGKLVRRQSVMAGRTMDDGRVWLDEKRLHATLGARSLYRKVARR